MMASEQDDDKKMEASAEDEEDESNSSSQRFRVRFVKADMQVQVQFNLKAEWLMEEEMGILVPCLERMSVGQLSNWCLADHCGRRLRLPRTMIFLGREDCDISIQSRSVDKRHAVLTFDPADNVFRVKDLGSVNGTFVNENRIPEQEYVTLDNMDSVRFGYDPVVYRMERIDELPHLEQAESMISTNIQLPAWATREAPHKPHPPTAPHSLAECQGCIAEQGIRHTCGSHEDSDYTPRAHGVSCAHVNGHVHCHQHVPGHGLVSPETAHNKWTDQQTLQAKHYSSTVVNGHYSATVPFSAPLQSQNVDTVDGKSEVHHVSSHTVCHGSCYSQGGLSQSRSSHALIQSGHSDNSMSLVDVGMTKSQSFSSGQNIETSSSGDSTQPLQFVPHPPNQTAVTSPGEHYPNVLQLQNVQRSPFGVCQKVTPVQLGQVSYPVPMDTSPSPHAPPSISMETQNIMDSSVPQIIDTSSPQVIDTNPQYIMDTSPTKDTTSPTKDTTAPASVTNGTAVTANTKVSPTSPESPGVRQDKRRSLTGADSDLETIRKCTPLYGQPAWWGEDESPVKQTKNGNMDAALQGVDQENNNSSAVRPSTLTLGPDGSHCKVDPRYGITYMEIPQRDTSAEKDMHTPPERDKPKGTSPGDVQAAPATAFMIEFGDEEKPKMAMGDGLSKFLPKKVRKSFKSRATKAKENKEAEDIKNQVASEVPAETWRRGTVTLKKSPVKQSGYHSDGHQSNISSDNEDLSFRSDITNGHAKKNNPTTGQSSAALNRDKTYTVMKANRAKAKAKAKAEDRKASLDSNSDPVPVSQYLIDRMLRSSEPEQDNCQDYRTDVVEDHQGHVVSVTASEVLQPQSSQEEPVIKVRRSRRDDDNISESGTYTIDVSEEVEEARQSIDTIFGVSSSQEVKCPVVDDDQLTDHGQAEITDEVADGIIVSDISTLNGDIESSGLQESVTQESQSAQEVPPGGKEKVKEGQVKRQVSGFGKGVFEEQRSGAWADADTPVSPEDAQHYFGQDSVRRPRSGTGRKLPTPPVQQGQDPGRLRNSFSAIERSGDSLNEVDAVLSDTSRPAYGRAASVDTELLLRDTEHVVQVMAERMQRREQERGREAWSRDDTNNVLEQLWGSRETSPWRRDTITISSGAKPSPLSLLRRTSANEDSDSDNSSTFAVVNGHEPKGRPRYNQSVSADTSRAAKPGATRTTLLREKKSAGKDRQSPRMVKAKHSSMPSDFETSDLMSDHSDISAISSDHSESHSPRTSRKIMKSKSPISLAKPNRAFALRQARAKGTEPETRTPKPADPPRSRPASAANPHSRPGSVTKDIMNTSRSRPSSSTPRSRPGSAGRDTPSNTRSRPNSARDTEASLGAHIVAKSRENQRMTSSASAALARTDGGRHSLRAGKVSTAVAPVKLSRTPDPTRDKKMSRSLSLNKNDDSRSSSPQTDEYSAWKRRKGYDPRRAVAEAKSKLREARSAMKERSQSLTSAAPSSARSSISEMDGYFAADEHNEGFLSTGAEVTNELTRMSQEVLREASSLRSLTRGQSGGSAFSLCPSKSPNTPATPPLTPLPGRLPDRAEHPNSAEWLKKSESYDSILASSIYHLSMKVKNQTDRIVDKLKVKHQFNTPPSPIDDLVNQPMENGNQELANTLRNLRHTEHHLQRVERVLFPSPDGDSPGGGPQNHQKYMRELERIRGEMAGFKPIEKASGAKMSLRRSSHTAEEPDCFGEDYY